MKIRGISGTAKTTTGTKDFTLTGFGTVTGVIVIACHAYSGASQRDDLRFSYGMSDGTRQWCARSASENAVTPQDSGNEFDTDEIVTIQDANGTEDWSAAFDSFITDGVRLNFTNAASNAEHLTIILIGDTTNLYVGNTTLSGTGAHDITAPGFKGNLLFGCTNFRTVTTPQSYVSINLGFAHNNSSDVVTQAGVTFWENNATNPTQAQQYVRDSDMHYYVSTAEAWTAESFDANGFSINTGAIDPGGDYFGYMIIDTGNTNGVKVSVEDSPTSTGDWSVTSPGFTPQFGMLLAMFPTAVDTRLDAPAGLSVGAFDANNEAVVGVMSQDEYTSSSNEKSNYATNQSVQLYSDTGLEAEGAFSSFDANGYTINFPTTVNGTTRKWVSLAIEEDVTPVTIGTKINLEYNRAVTN